MCEGGCSKYIPVNNNTQITMSNPINCGGCSGRSAAQGTDQRFYNNFTSSDMSTPIIISAAKLKIGDPYTLLKFAFFADKNAFIRAFRNAGLKFIDKPEYYEEQLQKLAWLYTSGADKAGKMHDDATNAPIFFNVMEVYGTIQIDKSNLDRSGIVLTQ